AHFRPSKRPARAVQVPDPDVGALQRKACAFLGRTQNVDGSFALRDVLCDDQGGIVPGKGERVRRDVHVDERTGLETVSPGAGRLPRVPWWTGMRDQLLDILGGADI